MRHLVNLVKLSSVIACGKIEESGEIVKHLLNTSHTTAALRNRLSAQLGDMIMKLWILVGLPVAILALATIAKAEKEAGMPVPPLEDQFHQSIYSSLDTSDDIEDRGHAAMRLIYRSNLDPIMASWGLHQADFEWLEKRVVYGLFLSDNRILDQVESECLNVAGIMCQGLERPTMWHIRGLRRLGVTKDNAEIVCNVIKKAAREIGGRTDVDNWLNAVDVEA